MDISIIIVSYNTRELLLSSLKSQKAAAKNLKVEIFVVDNASSDKTANALKKNYPEVKLIENQKNLGFSKANNQVITRATGKYVLILNPDTKVMPDTLEKMVKFMDQNRNISISTCRVTKWPARSRLPPAFPDSLESFLSFFGPFKDF